MKLACAGTLLISLAIATVATSARAGDYPPELDAAEDCTLWRGTASGNDPTVRVMFRLCPAGDAVAGTSQWSSKVSGYNVRRLSGRWLDNGARLELHDEALIEQHPEKGWRFCTVDRYDLVHRSDAGDSLTGTYDSRACNDHGTVEVTLVPGGPPSRTSGPTSPPTAGSTSAAGSSAPSGAASSPPVDTHPKPSSRSCGCSCPGQPVARGGGLMALLALLALMRGRLAWGIEQGCRPELADRENQTSPSSRVR